MRRALEQVVGRALDRLDLAMRVEDVLDEEALLRVPPRSVDVIAIGKAAPRMTKGALVAGRPAIGRVLVVTSDGTDLGGIERDRRVSVLRAGHPVPDRRSLAAGERCLALAGDLSVRPGATLLVLVSGGASALVVAPADGVSLGDKQRVTRAMLRSGAAIQEINVVRKHLSRIKGGGLARAASPARVITLVASDVVGGRPGDVGSGPSVLDRTKPADARRLLARYAEAFGALPLTATPASIRGLTRPRVVASPEELARAVAVELGADGYLARVLRSSQAPVEVLAAEYRRLARRLAAGHAVVRAAEPAIVVPRGVRGRGGRSTHLATLVGAALPPDVVFLAAATDGVDGASGTAGAIVDGDVADRMMSEAATVTKALARFDTGALHLRWGTARLLRPSGHNLADLHVLVRRDR